MTATVPQTLPLDVALRQALTHHQAGRLHEAEELYRAILQADPHQPDANHNLGVLAGQMGQHAAGLPYLKAALAVNPAQGQYSLSYAEALLATGQAGEALDILQSAMQRGLITPAAQALRQRVEAAAANSSAKGETPTPVEMNQLVALFNARRYAEAESRARLLVERYPNSGFAWKVLGASLQVQGKETLPAMQRAVDLLPDDAQAHSNLGAALKGIGRLDGAVACYRRALEIKSDYAEAHFNLGNVLHDLGQFDGAVASYRRALEIKPQFAEAHYNLGNPLKILGRLDDALASYRRALEINPRYAEAHNNLGNVLQDLGRFDDAVVSYRRALEIKPDYAEAYSNLGITLKALARLDEAVASCRRALEINPGYAEAHYNLSSTLQALGRLDEAVASCRHALEINPGYAEAHYNLGAILQDLGLLDRAVASYRQALEIKPDHADAHYNLGNALKALGQLDRAAASYRRALEIKPGFTEAHNNLGVILLDLGKPDEAVASCRRALEIKPDHAEAHNNLGMALQALRQLDDAVASYRRALELNPDHAETHNNLGGALQALGRLDEAVASYRRALEINPGFADANSNLLFCLNYSEAVDAATLFSEHCRFAEQFEAPLRINWPQHTNSRVPDRCLQIGFVSGDLRNHAVANYIEPLLAHLAGYPQLSLHGYCNHVIEDAVTQRLRKYLPHWHAIAGLSDDALAQKIRADSIDMLIDLSGHTARNRLLTFARKPAPLQASWLGYPGTTGLSAMDYYLADRFFLPRGQFDSQFTEKIVHLPASAPFLPSKDAPPVNSLPAANHGYMTFGSFNRPDKLGRSVIALWAQLLHALPNSRMLLGGMPEKGKYGTLIEWFAQEGIARERLSFHARSSMDSYLGLHHQVDICLDTFPYNGGTTTLHALWMGVPTLTLAGSTAAGRSGASILGHVGLEAFVAHDADDFVRKGLFWAGNLAALSNIRAGLRERFAKSAKGQPALVAEGLQRALRTMWQRWCARLPAESFEVSLQGTNNMTQDVGK